MSWAGRYYASRANKNQGGGNAKEGLPPSVGKGSLSLTKGMSRAYGTPEDRELQVCINQLGSVNPRVYQSRYCGKRGGGGVEKICEYVFDKDKNQWTDDSTTSASQYDICLIMDRSGSMNTNTTQGSRWSQVQTFAKNFNAKLLQRQKTPDVGGPLGAFVLPGVDTKAPSTLDANVGTVLADYNDPNVAPIYRLSFISLKPVPIII